MLAVAATAAMPTAAAAKQAKLKTVNVGLNHPSVVPVVHVKWQDFKWRLLKKDILFVLHVFVKVNVGMRIQKVTVRTPADGIGSVNRKVFHQVKPSEEGKRSIHLWGPHGMPQWALGKFGTFAEGYCKQQLSSGKGKFRKDMSLPVEIVVEMKHQNDTFIRAATRRVKIQIFCDGLPDQTRAGNAPKPKPLRVTFARVKLIKVGQHCPRKVIASVLIQTNTPGKVPYVLRSKRGYRWTRELSVQFRNPQGIHQASRDHIFHVKKSTRDEFWLEIKGRRRSPIRKPLKVVCVKGGPKGLTK